MALFEALSKGKGAFKKKERHTMGIELSYNAGSFHNKILKLEEFQITLDKGWIDFMSPAQSVSSILSRGIHLATPLEIAFILMTPRLAINVHP